VAAPLTSTRRTELPPVLRTPSQGVVLEPAIWNGEESSAGSSSSEAVKLVVERGVGFAQAARDLDLHVNVLRKWVREQATDPRRADR